MKRFLSHSLLFLIVLFGSTAVLQATPIISFMDGVTAISPANFDQVQTEPTSTTNTRLGSGACTSIADGGVDNTCLGSNAGTAITTGDRITAIGDDAATTITTNADITAVGHHALTLNTAGGNSAFGSLSLDANVQGVRNVAVGYQSGTAQSAVGDNDNTWIGYNAGLSATGSASGKNTVVGSLAGDAITTSAENTAIGYKALSAAAGNSNTAVGADALERNTASDNSAVGAGALFANVIGVRNTAFGRSAGSAQAGASDNNNTWIGYNAGAVANGSASGQNTAVGTYSMNNATTGERNTSLGYGSLSGAGDYDDNVAVGQFSLNANTANANTGVGVRSLYSNVTGLRNVAVGYRAGESQAGVTDDDNTWVGYDAGRLATGSSSGSNTGVGAQVLDVLTTGIQNTVVGSFSGGTLTTGSGNTIFGSGNNASSASGAGQIILGDNLTGTANSRVHIGDGTSHIYADYNSAATWTHSSDARMKNYVGPSSLGLAFINNLDVLTYRFKPVKEWPKKWKASDDGSIDTKQVHTGLFAQDVQDALRIAGVDPDSFAGWDKLPNGKQQISEAAFIFPLIQAIHELTVRVEELESRQ